MGNEKPLYTLYKGLKAGDYDVPENYDSFERTLTEAGQNGANSRRALYSALKENDYDVPDSYEHFYSTLFEPVNDTTSRARGGEGQAVQQPQKPAATTTAPAQKPAQKRQQGTPMTEAERLAMGAAAWQLGQTVQQTVQEGRHIGRMLEPYTQKGREARRARETRVRLAGTPTQVAGVRTPVVGLGATAAETSGKGNGAAKAKDVSQMSERSPQPYGVVYDDAGNAKTQWMLPDGTLTTNLQVANNAEADARTARLAHQFRDRMHANGLDPEKEEDVQRQAQLDYEAPMRKAIDAVWQAAEEQDKADDERWRREGEKASHGSLLSHFLDAASTDANGLPMQTSDEYRRNLDREVQRRKTFDLQRMAQTAYDNMDSGFKDEQLRRYNAYYREHPDELKGRSVAQASEQAARMEVYRGLYERVVQKDIPKSTSEFILRKVAEQPLMSTHMATEAAASGLTGNYDLGAADTDAMWRYGSEHKVADLTGTILNMALDPTVYASGVVGGVVGKAVQKGIAKAVAKGMEKKVAERMVASSLAGRLAAGVGAGAGNFATFEAAKNVQKQMKAGGEMDAETGTRELSAGEVMQAAGRGVLLGALTGTVAPVLGNVVDPMVKATTNTAGKVALRAGETGVSAALEGTVFAIPEWAEDAKLADDDPNKRGGWDIWTDQLFTMLGFKASHAVKSVPAVLAGLRPVAEPKTMAERNHNRMSFFERLDRRMDASAGDLDFTRSDQEELWDHDYQALAKLLTPKGKKTRAKTEERPADGDRTVVFDDDVQEAEVEDLRHNPDFDGYAEVERLMQDKDVSQAVRAKVYYMLTGRRLQPGTIMGYTEEERDEDGGVMITAVTSDGEVVTRRYCKDAKAAEREKAALERQIELNGVDVGERYMDARADAKVMEAAIDEVAPGSDAQTVMDIYRKVKAGDKDLAETYGKLVEDIDKAVEDKRNTVQVERPEDLRAAIAEEQGVDIDKALRKQPGDRDEREAEAVGTYLDRLYNPRKEKSEEEANAETIYDESRLLWGKVEEGDAEAKADVDAIIRRVKETSQRCEEAFGTDAERRMVELDEDPWGLFGNPELTEYEQDAVLDYINAKAALEGVQDASNDAMERKRQDIAATVEHHTHKDSGMVQQATLKVDDAKVYIVKGNVVPFADGTGVDVRQSDQSIVVCDAQTGEYKFVSPDQIFSVGEAIDPQTELDEAYASLQAEYDDALRTEEPTDMYLAGRLGAREYLEQMGYFPDWLNEQTGERLLEVANEEANKRMNAGIGAGAGTEGGEAVADEGAPSSPAHENGEAEGEQPLTEEQVRQSAHGAFNEAMRGESGVELPKGQVDELQDYNRQMAEEAENRRQAMRQRQEVEQAAGGETALSRVPVNEDTQEPMFEEADAATALDALGELARGNWETVQAVVDAQSAQAQKALETLKKRKQPKKKAATLTGSPMEMMRQQQEAEAAYARAMEQYEAEAGEAERKVQAWNNIKDEIARRQEDAVQADQEETLKSADGGAALPEGGKAAPGNEDATSAEGGRAQDKTEEPLAKRTAAALERAQKRAEKQRAERKRKKAEAEKDYDMEPHTPTELAASMLGSGAIRLERSSFLRHTGYGNREAQKMLGILASREKGGMTMEEAGEQVLLADEDLHLLDHDDANAGLNAVLDALHECKTKGELQKYILNNRIREREDVEDAEREREEAARDEFYIEQYHLTYDEYVIYTEEMLPLYYEEERRVPEDVRKANLEEMAKMDKYYENNGRETGGRGAVREEGPAGQGRDEGGEQGGEDTPDGQMPVSRRPVLEGSSRGKAQGHDGGLKQKPSGKIDWGTYDKAPASEEEWVDMMRFEYEGRELPKEKDMAAMKRFVDKTLSGAKDDNETTSDYTASRSRSVELRADKLYKSEKDWFSQKKYGEFIAFFDEGEKAVYKLAASKDAQGWLSRVTLSKETYAGAPAEGSTGPQKPEGAGEKETEKQPTGSPSKEPNNAEEGKGYSIVPSTYTNKRGKTSAVSLLTFDHDLTADQERAVKEFAKERTGEERFAPARGWKDRENGGWIFRNEEDARKAAEMVGNEDAVADRQSLTAQELRDAVEPKKPATRKKTPARKPANKVEVADVVEQKPAEPAQAAEPSKEEKPQYEVSDEEMNGLMNDIRDILGIGDDEGDAGLKFRDPDELTAEQRQKLMSVGQRLAMAMVERGNESFGDYASMMVKALGNKVRPWLKAFYGGLEYVPGYDKYALTPYEEVKAFDVENFDKPQHNVLAQADMLVEESKAQVVADKANTELKEIRNEQRKELDKQAEADTAALASEAETVAGEAAAVAKTSRDRRTVCETSERVDEALDKIGDRLALLGYYEADHVAKDFNEATGYMRNAEKKAVKDAADLASSLIDDLGLDRHEATHGAPGKNGTRKTKPLAVANIAPAGGEVAMHLPLDEGRELYMYVALVPVAEKGVTGFEGDNLQVDYIMWRVENPNAKGSDRDRYGQNFYAKKDTTYKALLEQVQRAVYKYIPQRTDVVDGEYKVGDKVEYTHDGGRTWTEGVVAQPNDMGGIRIDTGQAPVMWVNATKKQLRHKRAPQGDVDAAIKKAKDDITAKLEQVKDRLDEKTLLEQIAQRDDIIDELDLRVRNGERKGTFSGIKNVDLQATLLKCIGERAALEEARDNLHNKPSRKPSAEDIANNPQSWVGKTFTYNGMQLVCTDVDKGYVTFDNKTTFMGQGFDVSTVQGWLKNGKMQMEGATPAETKVEKTADKPNVGKSETEVRQKEDKPHKSDRALKQAYHKQNWAYVSPKPGQEQFITHTRVDKDGKINMAVFQDGKIVDGKNGMTEQEFKDYAAEQGLVSSDLTNGHIEAEDRAIDKVERNARKYDQQEAGGGEHPKPAKKQPAKKVKPEQPVGDLFAGLSDKEQDNELERNHDAVRAGGLPSDSSRDSRGGSVESDRTIASQRSGRPDGSRESESGRARREVPQSDRRPDGRLQGLGERKNVRNNHSERGVDHAPKTVGARYNANIEAIKLAHELLESGQTATPEQMSVLRKYSGWGGLGSAFVEGRDWKQSERNRELRELLGEKAYDEALLSANSAYYTPAYVVDTLWDIARQLGFKGGNILEGSAGIGNIIGQIPMDMSDRSDIHAIEIDGTSGGILSLLYPDAKVDIQGFEQTRIPNGSVDLAITNVPFVTGLRVNDTTGDSDLSKKFHNIHDFCIAKNVRKLREGGLGIFISSSGTLDNSKALRDWVVNEGGSDFIGAFRMHNETFGETPVTSDVIVIRKRVNGKESPNAIDVSTVSGERAAEYQEPGERKKKQLSMDYNKYFIEHPDHMAGEMHFGFEKGDTYRPASKGLYPVNGKDQGEMLQAFVKTLVAEEKGERADKKEPAANAYEKLGKGVKEGSMVIDGSGNICIAQHGEAVPLKSEPSKADKSKGNVSEDELRKRFQDKKIKGHTKAECFRDYTAIKTALADVMKYQTENEGDGSLHPLLAKLNKAYDSFVEKYGHFSKNNQLAWLRGDVDYPNVFSLEEFKEVGDGKGGVTQTFGKADVMKHRVVEKETEPHPENVKDGVVVSMFKNGRIDVPYIAEQLGKSEKAVKRQIIEDGLGFEDPATRQMEVSYQYLSGNVREKLRQAEANNDNGEYSKNIKALQDVVPMDIPAHLIDFTLGSSWLPSKLYEEYVKDRTDLEVKFTAVGGSWYMDEPYYVTKEKNRAMGVVSKKLDKTIFGHEIIAAALQNKTIIVSKTEKHWDGTTETITDREATTACAAKVDEVRQDFKDWMRQKMQSDADLSARMEKEYNDRFNNYVPMRVPAEFVPEYFGGAAHKFKMRPHQGRAIVRGTMQPLMLAHEVGTGKTFTLISTAMEMRRLGTARKPMIVVQNATVGQFVSSAKELYPNAKILTLEDGDRNAEGRKNFYAKIKYNDWDMIVVPQSTFERIPDSGERQLAFIQAKIDEKINVLEKMKAVDSSGRNPVTRQAEREIESLRAEMGALSKEISAKRSANDEKKRAVAMQNAAVKAQEMLDRQTDDVENFDDMGIDALLVDEAHEYKHLGFATAMQRGVKGVDPSYSKKSQGVYLKAQAVLQKNHGRNVVFATGTPISNTAAEIWTFMRYLMPEDTMKEYGIYYFDDFVRNFGNIQQMPEFGASGKFKEVSRFAGYVNLPELVRIWSGVADTVLTKDQTELVKKIPEMEGGKAQDIYLPQTRALRSVMKYVKAELQRFEEMDGLEKKENSHIPLVMYGIAQGAAVDARLVVSNAEDEPNSKTNEAVRQTLRSLKETEDYKGTVAIFADHYQNKRSGFNLFEDVKKKLVEQGVPEKEIVIMRSGMSIKAKLDIFEKVNHGEIRVILGSTATLGTGVNIQERLHTLIHLDAPNRPMDYTQRNGRILRQGNLHKEWGKPVRVLRFGVEDSLDVTAYQRLKTKGAIADSVMEGDKLMSDSMNNRVLEEEEDVFGDTVAQLSGSEYALLKNNAEKNVRKYESRKRQWEADQTYIHNAKPKLESQIKAAEQRAEDAASHLQAVKKAFPDGKSGEITIGNKKFGSVAAMADFIKDYNKKITDGSKAMKESPADVKRKHELTLTMGGLNFVVNTELSREVTHSDAGLFAEVHRNMTYSCPELGLKDVPVKQSLLRNALEDITENVITGKDFEEQHDNALRAAEHGKSELEQLKSREGKPFEYDKELEEAQRQLEEYTEAMKQELEEKEKKYAEMDASVEAATDVAVDEEEDVDEEKTKFRLLEDDDPKARELEALKDNELVEVYRNVQAFEDDDLGSPMAFTDAVTGERRTLKGRRWNYSAPKEIKLTDEQQRRLDELNRNGYIMVDGKKVTELKLNDALKFVKPKEGEAKLQYFLKKNSEDGGLWADYNPYDHAVETPLNTQFASAYKRPNLVVVRCLIPKSELDEPYHADYAAKPTGAHLWNNGRTLYLSRWSKIDKVLTREEEAELIDKYWKANPQEREKTTHRDYNRFVPQVRRLLEEKGYRFELNDKMRKELEKKGYHFEPAGKELTPEESRRLDELVWEERDVIPGKEGQVPFVTNEDIARINAKMSGKWVGVPKAEMEEAMTARVTELSERLNTPVHIVRTDEEVAALPSVRQRRMKGSFNPMTGEVTIVVPNNANMADVENTFVHEVVGHSGLRVLFPEEEKLNNALDEMYRMSKDEIRQAIDSMAQKMYDAEVDRIREHKRREHEAKGENSNASYYADMAEAHVEAAGKREQMKRDATEEYAADLAGRIGEEGFEKMSAGEQTFWGKVKAVLQKALDALLKGLKIPGKRQWNDKDWAFVLHEAYKRKKNGGRPSIFDAADTEVMRRKTGYGEATSGKEAGRDAKPETSRHDDGDIMFRDGDDREYEKAMARGTYERRVSRGMYQTQEALQDSMLGLKEAMDAVLQAEGKGKKVRIEDVPGYENPYLGENRLSSVNQAEASEFNRKLFKPLLQEVSKLAKTAGERAELTDYMMAKHGLERNEVMARRAAEKQAMKELGAELRNAERALNDDPLDPLLQFAVDEVKQRMDDREEDLYFENRAYDYSGLTALTKTDNVADAEDEARNMVQAYEGEHDTAGLWAKTQAVTEGTLAKAYQSGMIDRDTYNDIKGMYDNYIPLRGFDETTSDEVYAYLNDRKSGFSSPIKTAKGRKSKADDPFANMEAMAESAIMQGNRNVLVKQKMLNFALAHPSDLVSVSDLWLRYDDVKDEWMPMNTGDVAGTEALEPDDTPAEVEAKMETFEEAMRQLSAAEPDKFVRQKEHPNIPYRVVETSMEREHQVIVKRNGKDYVLTINGNPRAAQALNGQTNPDNDQSGALGKVMHWGEVLNRQLSAFYTTRNPDFVVSNFMRDAIYSNTMAWVKESPGYAWRFHKNFTKVNPAKMKMLFARLRNGELDMNDRTDKLFYQFMMNGGETGYSNLRDTEQRKNDIKRELKKNNGKLPLQKAWALLGERFDEYNRAAENCARFAAFVTSMEMKRSVERAVWDAKEISVNFNKKGSGAKFIDATGEKNTARVASFLSGAGRSLYVFWNAAIQGTWNFGKNASRNPKKALGGAAAMFLLGAVMAALGNDDDDDTRNSYYNLPEYVRRSNIVFRLPGMDEQWISIPLPVEYRVLYGLGELAASALGDKEHKTGGELAAGIAGQLSQALPIDFLEGGGGWNPFVPSSVKPFAEVLTNKGWTGMPIYSDNEWNKDMPEWTKAYQSANEQLVDASKLLNEATGGDRYTPGAIDINPAMVEYLLTGYFGGVANTINRMVKMGETVVGDREYDPKSFLIVNRLVKNGDERTESRALTNEYYRLRDEYQKTRSRLVNYENDTDDGVFDYADKIAKLNNSPEYRRMEIFEEYGSDIDAISKELKDETLPAEDRKALTEERTALMRELVERVNASRKQQ